MILEYRTITKTFSGREALSKVSFSLTEGVCALLGPNGAGKSTLMNIAAGLWTPDYGEILLDGMHVQDPASGYYERIGYAPQSAAGYPGFTTMMFLQYMAELKGTHRRRQQAEAEQALRAVDLWDERRKNLRELSGGMRQRLNIAQAFLGNSDIIILDEPTTGLDPEQRVHIRNLIAEQSKGKIVLFATHVVTDIELIADTILILNNGKLLLHKKRNALLAQMQGKVCELPVADAALPSLRQRFLVSDLTRDGFHLLARIILFPRQTKPANAHWATPTIQDAFLYALHQDNTP